MQLRHLLRLPLDWPNTNSNIETELLCVLRIRSGDDTVSHRSIPQGMQSKSNLSHFIWPPISSEPFSILIASGVHELNLVRLMLVYFFYIYISFFQWLYVFISLKILAGLPILFSSFHIGSLTSSLLQWHVIVLSFFWKWTRYCSNWAMESTIFHMKSQLIKVECTFSPSMVKVKDYKEIKRDQ